jgi:diaminohydroxyphosphoribosylaminopyrimidine deaminase/5-amino-6-(5-phosphoribosylamino)uracil reductase
MTFSTTDHVHMAQALRLAACGLYTTQPNPRVGCVIAHGQEVVGEGWHQRAGEPHAEVFALRAAAERARGATAYVTLEPCAHHGRTPPCAQALIAAGVARVVIAVGDPFAQVAGRGIAMLREAGISVDIGLMHEAVRELNIGFFSRIERGRPWLRVKLAMSLDGRTALSNGESKWITGEPARADVQRWRARSSAILTGSGTVLADNPLLTVRLGEEGAQGSDDAALAESALGGEGQATRVAAAGNLQNSSALLPSGPVGADDVRSAGAAHPGPLPTGESGPVVPWRVVLDRRLQTPAGSYVLDGSAPTLLLHAADAVIGDDRFARVERAVVASGGAGMDLRGVLTLLAARDINEVHVEAGPRLCGALFAAGLVDELLLYVAPLLLGDAARPLLQLPTLTDMADRWQLRTVDQRMLGDNWRLRLRPA